MIPRIFNPLDVIDIKRHLSHIPECSHEGICIKYSELFSHAHNGRMKANNYLSACAREFRVPKVKLGVIGNGKV